MGKTLKRTQIKGELRERVKEQLYDWIKRNPDNKLPSSKIAIKYGVASSQVHTCVLDLQRDGKIRRVSKYLWAIAEEEPPAPGQVSFNGQSLTPPPVVVSLPSSYTVKDIIALAKTFKWTHDSDSLREFVDWLEVKGKK